MQKGLISQFASLPLVKSSPKQSFGAQSDTESNNNKEKSELKTVRKNDDYIVDPTIKNKTDAQLSKIGNTPSYVKRGLGGDPDFNFYEFMQITKIPYFLGGPGLVATILAGKSAFDIKANKAAKFNAKGMALGCAFYYLMMAIAQKCVDIPVKIFRGIDLNQPYVDVVSKRAQDPSGYGSKKYEYHNVYESSKFIRWDLLYNKDAKDPKRINAKYDLIAKKMGLDEEQNDSDSAVKPVIMQLIKQSMAWKDIIGAFAVMLGVGLGNQQAMKDEFATGMFSSIKSDIKNLFNAETVKRMPMTLNTKIFKPLYNSIKGLWKGSEDSVISKHAGKFAILGFLASVLTANISILKSTNIKNNQNKSIKEGKE